MAKPIQTSNVEEMFLDANGNPICVLTPDFAGTYDGIIATTIDSTSDFDIGPLTAGGIYAVSCVTSDATHDYPFLSVMPGVGAAGANPGSTEFQILIRFADSGSSGNGGHPLLIHLVDEAIAGAQTYISVQLNTNVGGAIVAGCTCFIARMI